MWNNFTRETFLQNGHIFCIYRMPFSARRDNDAAPNSGSSSSKLPNSGLENTEPNFGTQPQLKTNSGSADTQNNRNTEFEDKGPSIDDYVTKSVTRSSTQTHLQSGSTSPARTSGQNKNNSSGEMSSTMETF